MWKIFLICFTCNGAIMVSAKHTGHVHRAEGTVQVSAHDMKTMTEQFEKLSKTVAELQEKVNILEGKVENELENSNITPLTYSAYNCAFNQLTLQCPENQTIFLENALYGLYQYTSTQEDLTCKPSNYVRDCTEPMLSNSPGDWLLLQERCNGANSCTFTTQAGLMTSCGDVVGADFTEVVYQCLPGSQIREIVAFSVRPSSSRTYTCPNDEPAIFDTVITDTSNSWDTAANSFTCPITGEYMFTLTIRNPNAMYAVGQIMLDSAIIAISNCHDNTNAHNSNQATNSVIRFCQAGQKVWVRSDCLADAGFSGGDSNMFSGFLIN